MVPGVSLSTMSVYRRAISKNGRKHLSRNWYCVDPLTGKERSLRVTDKAVAEIIYGDLKRAKELRTAGIETFPETRRRPAIDFLEPYLAELVRRHSSPYTVKNARSCLRWLLAQVRSIEDLTPNRVAEILAQKAREAGLVARTQNYYRAALSGFFRWLIASRQWGENPVKFVGRARVRGNEGFERAPLTVEQLTALVERVPIWRGAVYLMAGATGLRRGELRQLLEADVNLEAATVRVRARVAKNAQEAVLPLNGWVVDVLRQYLAEVPRDRKIQPRVPPRGDRLFTAVPTVETLHRDLAKFVGLGKTNAEGHRYDFHGLRTTFVTMLARQNVPPALARDLARHSDIRLTMSAYTKLTLHDGRAAVEGIRPSRGAGQGAGDTGDSAGDGRDLRDGRTKRGSGAG